MQLQNLIKSTAFVELTNKLDNLINELLYSKNDGYINLSSKDALNNIQNVIDKFDFESDKISKEYSFSNAPEIISNKKNTLIEILKKHYSKEAYIWANEVFRESVENCLLNISINSDNNEIVNDMKKCIMDAVNWISFIEGYSTEEKKALIGETNKKLNKALNSKDSDYISLNNPIKSDCETFLKIRNMVIDDCENFLKLDFSEFKTKLSVYDINYFQKIQNSLKYDKNTVIDDINLINYATRLLNTKNDAEKYDFIVQLNEDFKNLSDKTDENKAKIAKKRIELFNCSNKYYSKLFGA